MIINNTNANIVITVNYIDYTPPLNWALGVIYSSHSKRTSDAVSGPMQRSQSGELAIPILDKCDLNSTYNGGTGRG